ncbi:Uncharacterised protein [Enterobacter cloacae]|nr:Uncharacterised protein [Enterobacter cloacae]
MHVCSTCEDHFLKIAASKGIRRLTNQRQPFRFFRMMGFLHNLHGQRADRRGVAQVIDKIQRLTGIFPQRRFAPQLQTQRGDPARPSPEKAR